MKAQTGVETPHNPDIIVASTAQRFSVPDRDANYPLAEPQLKAIGKALLKALTDNGIDPFSVVLAGYDRTEDAAAVDAFKVENYGVNPREDIQERIHVITEELESLHAKGILSASKRAELVAELNIQRGQLRAIVSGEQLAPLPTFHFAEVDAMFDNHKASNNPIEFAGAYDGATIGVYDRARLQALDGEVHVSNRGSATDRESIHFATISREALESTKLMEYYPRYTE